MSVSFFTMLTRHAFSSLLLSSVPLLATLVSSTSVPTKCYFLDGNPAGGAGYRCDNTTTGHSSCCSAGGICYSNGVCQQSNGNVQDYLRVGCTDITWKDPACLDQCTSYAIDSTAGIRFCKGAITSTNKYCCDPGGHGIGSFACCNDPSDIFAINPIATVLAQIPLNYVSSSSSSSSTSTSSSASSTSASTTSSTAAPTTTASVSPTPTPEKKSSDHSAAIGAGVGVPVGILALAGIAFFWWRHRKNVKKQQAIELENNSSGYGQGQYTDNHSPPTIEAEGSTPGVVGGKKGYFSGRGYDAAPQVPQELSQPDIVHEMGTDTAR